MGLNVLPVCVKVHLVCTMPEETSGALGLVLQVVASHHVEAENLCLVLYQSSTSLNCGAIVSPALGLGSCKSL